ncbi:hypothetical protein, partial [Streptomyces pratensis]|uniref:hypothetical protein n=1 Tax=Streptomyces pratensis TaxID=1169025 RepID=UPI003635A465
PTGTTRPRSSHMIGRTSPKRPKAPADGHKVEWPTSPPLLDSEARLLHKVLTTPSVFENMAGALTVFANAFQHVWQPNSEATRQFIDEERENKIRMDMEADAMAEAVDTEGWDLSDGDDLWRGLD